MSTSRYEARGDLLDFMAEERHRMWHYPLDGIFVDDCEECVTELAEYEAGVKEEES